MSGLPQDVRQKTDILDTVGNTKAATGKGFAIASTALTSLALFAAYVRTANIQTIDIYKASVMAGLFVGEMIPFLDIATKAALKAMLLPGALAIVTPIIAGFVFGLGVLGGLLAGLAVGGVLMALFQANAGGARDNAKKSFEKDV
jgi:K(+)-stimulated pyrophosphate-energized sodium pump